MSSLIFTNHALERMNDRKIAKNLALQTFSSPDAVHNGKKTGTKEFRKKFDKSTLTLIALQNDKNEWVVLSCWIDPPIFGTKANFWGKILFEIKKQLGL